MKNTEHQPSIIKLIGIDRYDALRRRFTEDATTRERKRIKKALKGLRNNLVIENDPPTNCNPRCHDSGKDEAFQSVLDLLDNPTKE